MQGRLKRTFSNGASLRPVAPVAMGEATRGVELKSEMDVNERQIAAWMKQVTAMPGVGQKRR